MGIFVAVNLISIIVFIFVAKYMVKNEKGLAKRIVIGRDSEETIDAMKKIVRDIVRTGKFEIDESSENNMFEEFDIKMEITKGCISKVKVETSKTMLIYEISDDKPTITNNGISKRGAIAIITFELWGIESSILFMAGLLASVIGLI